MGTKESLLLLSLSLFHSIQLSSSTVVLLPSSISFPDLPAKFSRDVDSSGLCGPLYVADPLDACSPLRNRFQSNQTEEATRLVLIIRGECAFEDKLRNAQNHGFAAAVVYDDIDNRSLVYMMVDPEEFKIHAVFVSKEAGEVLMEHSKDGEGQCCIYSSRNDKIWTVFAISFITLTVMIVLLLAAFVTPRRWLYWQRPNVCAKSVDTKMLELLPRFTFSSATSSQCHVGETCAICLEDYRDGEVLRVLPCQHDQKRNTVTESVTASGASCSCYIQVRRLLLPQKLPPFASAGSSQAEVVTVDVKEAKCLLDSGYVYVDVRTVEEFKKGHVHAEKIFNIPYMFNTPEGRVKNPDFLKEISTVCKEEHCLVVGCQSGARSHCATADLLAAGFKNVSNMGGGYLAWVETGFPLKKMEEGTSLALTPTWSVATVITVMVSLGIFFHTSLKQFGKWLDKTKRKALLLALEKIKEELMLFGLLSLLMGHWIGFIAKICVKSSELSSRFYPCAINNDLKAVERILGHESFASHESLEQLHRLMFVLGITHVSYSFVAIALAMIKIYSWRSWENLAKTMAIWSLQDNPEAASHSRKMKRVSTFVTHRTSHPWSHHRVFVWLLCFTRQFWSSIRQDDYMALRFGFISTHQLPLTYDFHNYMVRSMEEEFRDIVGIRYTSYQNMPCYFTLMVPTVCFACTSGTELYFWLSFSPVILVLLIGTKLHRVVVKLALELTDSSPRMLLRWLHFYGPWVVSQIWCSFITFPLYVIITQMGSKFKKSVVSENVRKSLHGWQRRVKARQSCSSSTSSSPLLHGISLVRASSAAPAGSSEEGSTTSRVGNKSSSSHSQASASHEISVVNEMPVLRLESSGFHRRTRSSDDNGNGAQIHDHYRFPPFINSQKKRKKFSNG
ncbi:hypothetical protein Tsubulata_030217 [Turnera subulata]|uniref:Rhodanese domain-containing protein n=1 Tax=Turnera subulata TaxID=218843 RepID=A0A9Q0G6Q8_9ROSI|nr:hypothetical protein Tsubulata_030217 [Turnera subulata]